MPVTLSGGDAAEPAGETPALRPRIGDTDLKPPSPSRRPSRLAAGAADIKAWTKAIKVLVRRDPVPDFLLDVSLHRYLRKLVNEPPGLAAMYEARMF